MTIVISERHTGHLPSITDTRIAHASQNGACPQGTIAKPPRGATKQTSQQSSDGVASSAAVVESDVGEVVAIGKGSFLLVFVFVLAAAAVVVPQL